MSTFEKWWTFHGGVPIQVDLGIQEFIGVFFVCFFSNTVIYKACENRVIYITNKNMPVCQMFKAFSVIFLDF